tara:strand:- start:36074 stop:37204 length:1131 start_codon:yes stop_codon:yes gene_type:complete
MKKITLLFLLLFTVYSYSQSQLLSSVDETFNGSVWENSTGYNYEYEGNNLKTEAQFFWDGTAWTESDKTTFTYNTNNKAIEEVYQFYNGTQFENSDRTVYTYDMTTGDIIKIEDYDWQSGWVAEFRANLTYTGSLLTGGISEEYNGTSWENTFNTIITYNGNGTIDEITDDEWDGSAWVANSKSVFSYDVNDKISMISYQDWNGSAWEEDSNIVYVLDGNGNRTSETENYTIGGGSETTTYTYDTGALMSSFANPFADFGDVEYLFEDFPFVNKVLTSTTGSNYRTTYNYNNLLSIDNIENKINISLKIYPNPATDFVTVKSSENIKNIDVFSVLGQKMISTTDANLNIRQLSKGIYLLNIYLENGTNIVEKIIKE